MSTFIIKNDKLPDYFIKADKFYDIRSAYEGGKIIIFDNITFFNCYRSFLEKEIKTIETENNKIKKAKGNDILKNVDEITPHILSNFTDKPFSLQQIIIKTYNWVLHELKPILFPGYRIISENWTWRLTKTAKEAMHLDSYAEQNNDLHNIRLFINLDNTPRVWRVSHPLKYIYEKYYYLFKEIDWNAHPNALNNLLNKRVNWKDLPFHEIHFAPYSIWCCNSQLIPHQAYRGNKLAAYSFRIDPESMLSPELNFEKLAKHYIWDLGQS